MTVNRNILAKSLVLMVLTAALVYGYSNRPPTGYAGCFGEPNCTECHSDNPVNVGGGSFTLSSEPLDSGETVLTEGYVPNHPYIMVATIAQQGQSRWGFEMIARFEANGEQAGHFEPMADGFTSLQLFEPRGWEYIGHTTLGTRSGTPNGPVPFIFKWTAPRPEEIPAGNPRIVICGTGNAADNSFSPDGDYIYTTSRTISPNPDWFPASDEEEGDPMAEDGGTD